MKVPCRAAMHRRRVVRERLACRCNSATYEILGAGSRFLRDRRPRLVEAWHLLPESGCGAMNTDRFGHRLWPATRHRRREPTGIAGEACSAVVLGVRGAAPWISERHAGQTPSGARGTADPASLGSNDHEED